MRAVNEEVIKIVTDLGVGGILAVPIVVKIHIWFVSQEAVVEVM